jgi:CHAT domain-containing protein
MTLPILGFRFAGPSLRTSGSFRRELPDARFVHLATHGFFADESLRSAFHLDPTRDRIIVGGVPLLGRRSTVTARNPLLLSGIVLSGANQAETGASHKPGIFTAEEVAELDLSGTELVVLSACETGLGEVAGGEGVFGLQRAFGLAGARGAG